jgi:GTP-binding protein Era
MIRSIGIEARQRIEALLGSRVHLDLWVKVEPRWSRQPRRLRSLGYGPV